MLNDNEDRSLIDSEIRRQNNHDIVRANSGDYTQRGDVDLININQMTRSKKLRKTNLNFIVTNARSLAPKMESLIDYMEELDSSLSIITAVSYTHLTLPTTPYV